MWEKCKYLIRSPQKRCERATRGIHKIVHLLWRFYTSPLSSMVYDIIAKVIIIIMNIKDIHSYNVFWSILRGGFTWRQRLLPPPVSVVGIPPEFRTPVVFLSPRPRDKGSEDLAMIKLTGLDRNNTTVKALRLLHLFFEMIWQSGVAGVMASHNDMKKC